MPFAIRLDTEIKIAYQLVYGHCLFSDMFKVAFEPQYNPANRPRMKIIIDNREGDLETDQDGMKMFIKFIKDVEKTGFEMEPTAFLTNRKSLAIFIKTLELLVDDDAEIRRVFSSLDEAIDWLGETENAPAIHRIHDELREELRSRDGELP